MERFVLYCFKNLIVGIIGLYYYYYVLLNIYKFIYVYQRTVCTACKKWRLLAAAKVAIAKLFASKQVHSYLQLFHPRTKWNFWTFIPIFLSSCQAHLKNTTQTNVDEHRRLWKKFDWLKTSYKGREFLLFLFFHK